MRKHIVVVVVVVVVVGVADDDDDYESPRCFRVRPAGTYDSDLTITINLHCIASETYDPSTPIHIYPIFVLNVFLQTRQGACCADWRKRVT